MKNFVSKMAAISRASGHLAGIFLVICLVIVMASLIARNMRQTFMGSTQIAEYLMLGTIMFGMSYAMLTGSHIDAEIIVARLSKGTGRIVQMVFRIIGLTWGIFFTAGSWLYWYKDLVNRSLDTGSINMPLWIPQLLLALGSLLLLAQMVAKIIGDGLIQKASEGNQK